MKRAIKRTLNHFGWDLVRAADRQADQIEANLVFVHIGKNAGTQIVNLLDQVSKLTSLKISKVGHHVKLAEIEPSTPYLFSIRNPVDRFKSAFYSRKRKGQPRLYSEWSEHEALAFSRFEHANDLAENLFAKDARGADAMAAIQSISHTAMHQIDWFTSTGFFLETRPPVWIIRQEEFNQDFEEFLKRANLNVRLADLTVAKDAKRAHKNDYTEVPPLTSKAESNLSLWYCRDFEFYDHCVRWMEQGG